MAAAAAATLAVGGVLMIGVVVISDGDTDESVVVDNSPISTPTSTAVTGSDAPTTSAVPSTIADTSVARAAPSSSTQPSTSISAESVQMSRPIFDPAVCTSITAGESGPIVIDDFTLFARPSELAVPIQVIGDPIDGEARPFALIQRHFDRVDSQYKDEETVMINGIEVALSVYENGNGEATWLLPDGSQGYLRSRGLVPEQIVYIVEGLSPRPGDAEIPGFDFTPGPTGDETLVLVAEQMNTTVSFGHGAQSQCEVEETGYGYRVTLFDGDPIARYGAVIDRPVPLEVGIVGGAVAIISGIESDAAPMVDDLIQADEATWLALRSEPTIKEAQGSPMPISEAQDVIARIEPVVSSGESGFLTVQLRIEEGVPFLQVDSTDSQIAGEADYWEILVDGRLRHRASASPGSLFGFRLSEGPLPDTLTVTIRTIDLDGHIIQTTPELLLSPSS